MRISASLALVAAGLLGHSTAQAVGYGSPNGSPSGNPSGANPNGAPGNAPGSVPGSAPGTVPGSVPGGIPNSSPGSVPGSIPGGAPGSAPVGNPNGVPVTVPGSNPGSFPSSVPGGAPGSIPSFLPGGFPGSVPSILPGGVPGSVPSIVPGGVPSSVPSSVPGNGNVPGGSPNGSPGSLPGGGVSGSPTCGLTRTSTVSVFVTVFPTVSQVSPDGSLPSGSSTGGFDPNGSSPGSSGPDGTNPNGSNPGSSGPDGTNPNGSNPGSSGPEGSSPDGSTPDGSSPGGSSPGGSSPYNTVAQAPNPTEPPTLTTSSVKGAIKPFTTLTIDIWGSGSDGSSDPSNGSGAGNDNGSGADGNSGAGDNSGPTNGSGTGNDSGPGSPDDGSNSGPGDNSGPGNSSPGNSGPGSNSGPGGNSGPGSNSGSGDNSGPGNSGPSNSGPGSNSGPDSGSGPENGSGSAPSAAVPAPQYTGSNDAPVGSPGDSPEISPGGFPGGLPGGPSASTQFPAPMPSQTVGSENPGNVPSGIPDQQASGSLPVTTQAGPQVPAGNFPGNGVSGSLSDPYVTVTGADGLPTVVNGGSGSLPYPHVTVTGADGLPTVVNGGSGSTSPNPYVTITGADGLPTVVNGGNGSPVNSNPYLTITGADGLPTVVNGGSGSLPYPYVTVTGTDGLPTVVNGGNGSPVNSNPFVTITGADGLPTVVSGGNNVPQGQGQPAPTSGSFPAGNGQGLPSDGSIPQAPSGPLPQGPAGGSGSFPQSGPQGGVTTCATFTVIGPNGLPTVADSTWVIPLSTPAGLDSAGRPGAGVIQGTLSPIPIDASGTFPTAGFPIPGSPLGGPGGSGVTTCTSYTVTGADGLPTVVHSTWVIPAATPTVGAPAGVPGPIVTQGSLPSAGPAGIPTGITVVTGAPGGAAAITTCTSYTVIGTDGLPTVVDSTWVIPAPDQTIAGIPGGPSSASVASDALPNGIPSGLITQVSPFPGSPTAGPGGPGGPGIPGDGGITTCTSYTVIGPDGLPTVVDSTWVVPEPSGPPTAPGSPSFVSNGLPSGLPSGIPGQITASPGSVPPGNAGGLGGVTTCATYTVIGPDGLPTVIDSTWVNPSPVGVQTALPGNPSFVSNHGLPSGIVTGVPGQITGAPGAQSPGGPPGAGGFTTCTTFTAIGADGHPTIVDATWVIPAGNGLPTATNLGLPSGLPQATVTGGPQPYPPANSDAGPITAVTTAVIIGPDGKPTPVVQTVVIGASSALAATAGAPQGTVAGIPAPPPSGPVVSTGGLSPFPSGYPSLGEYGPVNSVASGADAASNLGGLITSGTITGTRTSTITAIVDPASNTILPGGAGGPPPAYNDPWGNGAPGAGIGQNPSGNYGPVPTDATLWPASSAYGPVPSPASSTPCTTTTLQTSTWINVISEQTTSYTFAYPLTTLATVTVSPAKRFFRRQESSLEASSAWTNSSSVASQTLSESTSSVASLSSALSSTDSSSSVAISASTSAVDSTATSASASSTASVCPTGGRIGNTTLNFDADTPGPIFNPQEDIWFSQGFLVAPPSSQQFLPYVPSSGGQVVEFVPPTLSNTTTTGSGDVAQIGVGPNVAKPCFKFDFLGANLGCDAKGNEQWCEFEVSAYRYNETSASEGSIAWSETKRVPACPTFAQGGCALTPVEFDGYNNITSILITVRVGGELRVWWGDDFKVGWNDNTCAAATCRASVPAMRVKRKTVESALRRGVWTWTPSGLQRLDDELVWESMN
ncbi:hypothetical protein G7046_g2017 [Stylonectria norvegica]|nr:hypothetical protein G7046_g2017 [Stylonectria norvegica]